MYNQIVDTDVTNRLVIYHKDFIETNEPKSVSKYLAQKILECSSQRRSMRMREIFDAMLDKLPEGVIIKDIDVMFNPEYQVDVLKILSGARKHKRYRVIWPGRCEDGKLIYAEEGYLDYKVFEIKNYNIECRI